MNSADIRVSLTASRNFEASSSVIARISFRACAEFGFMNAEDNRTGTGIEYHGGPGDSTLLGRDNAPNPIR